MRDKILDFNKLSPVVFKKLEEDYGYNLDEIKINELNGINWSTHHIYINRDKGLKIIIKQEPYYTDYGFSFFIHKLGTEEYNILYNVESEYQDDDNKFLKKSYSDLFSNEETTNIISGKYWKELGYIPFKISTSANNI